MNWKPLDFNPVTKVRSWFAPDRDNKRNVIRYEQDVEPILDANQETMNNGHRGWVDAGKTLKLVARVPIVLLYQWAQETGTKVGTPEFQEVMRIRLNDPDYQKVRTCPGAV